MSNLTGVYRGVIHDLTDPAKRGRAKLLVPAVYGNAVSGWANPVFLDSSTKVGDLAWVMFENADINRPAWLAVQPRPNLDELDSRYYTEVEVDDFLDTKQNILDRGELNTGDVNTIITPGTYRVWPGPTNLPAGAYGFGSLIVSRAVNAITQMYVSDQIGDDVAKGIWLRQDWNDDGWGSWVRISHPVQSQAEAESSSDTSARLTTGQRLFQAISKWAVTLANAQTIAGRKLFSTDLGMTQIDTPATPPAGQNGLYVKSDNGLYIKDSGGTERPVWSSAGQWLPYTPVWTASSVNPVLNNGTLTGRYRWTSPDTVEYEITLTMGSTTTYGSGWYGFSVPVPVSDTYIPSALLGHAVLAAPTRNHGVLALFQKATGRIYLHTDAGQDVTATVPFTFAAADKIQIKGSYLSSSTWAGSNTGYSPTVLATAVHLNPDFEIPNGGVPLNWNFFWGNGTRTVSMDTTPANVKSGTNSLKIVTAAASDLRAMSTTFDVPANAVVRNAVWVKAAAANTTVNIGGFFADSGANPEFFGSEPGLGFDGQDFIVGTEWQKITYTKACSPTTRRYRQMLSIGASSTVWFDQSETEIIGGGYRTGAGWTDYTPVWQVNGVDGSNPTGTGGACTGRYLLHPDGMVDYEITFRLGSSHTTTGGAWRWSLPFAAVGPAFGYKPHGTGIFYDDSATVGRPTFPYLATTTHVGCMDSAGNLMSISSPVAQVWGDAVNIIGRYRRA